MAYSCWFGPTGQMSSPIKGNYRTRSFKNVNVKVMAQFKTILTKVLFQTNLPAFPCFFSFILPLFLLPVSFLTFRSFRRHSKYSIGTIQVQVPVQIEPKD